MIVAVDGPRFWAGVACPKHQRELEQAADRCVRLGVHRLHSSGTSVYTRPTTTEGARHLFETFEREHAKIATDRAAGNAAVASAIAAHESQLAAKRAADEQREAERLADAEPHLLIISKDCRPGRGKYERPGRNGYTDDIARAGLFPLREVREYLPGGEWWSESDRSREAVPAAAFVQVELDAARVRVAQLEDLLRQATEGA